ncbi:hypothetical protein BRD19_01990 [Halobacteriales archaeon SW_7_65_23]|nr:MAG: hypothetical protein BRD19_01990 [Halobacteriales archaeon SW_7_65_23]
MVPSKSCPSPDPTRRPARPPAVGGKHRPRGAGRVRARERPTVNVSQEGSWVRLRLRYLVHPRRGQRVRNHLYEQILDRMLTGAIGPRND